MTEKLNRTAKHTEMHAGNMLKVKQFLLVVRCTSGTLISCTAFCSCCFSSCIIYVIYASPVKVMHSHLDQKT